jgi:hypothetical protein
MVTFLYRMGCQQCREAEVNLRALARRVQGLPGPAKDSVFVVLDVEKSRNTLAALGLKVWGACLPV